MKTDTRLTPQLSYNTEPQVEKKESLWSWAQPIGLSFIASLLIAIYLVFGWLLTKCLILLSGYAIPGQFQFMLIGVLATFVRFLSNAITPEKEDTT